MRDVPPPLVVAVVMIPLIMTGIISYRLGAESGRSAERDAAIKAGVARYEADPTTGAVKFVYIRCEPERGPK